MVDKFVITSAHYQKMAQGEVFIYHHPNLDGPPTAITRCRKAGKLQLISGDKISQLTNGVLCARCKSMIPIPIPASIPVVGKPVDVLREESAGKPEGKWEWEWRRSDARGA